MATVHMHIAEEQLSPFLIYLGIGTLQAILSGTVSPEVGIWTLGAPQTWALFEGNSRVSPEVITIFQTCDELSAIRDLAPEFFENEIRTLIQRLQVELSKIEDPIWNIKWTIDT